ncbi:MAG TPA: transposase, partial [Cyclobacteriaceae bacterium]
PPDAGVLVKYLNKNFPGANYYAAYEAGYSGFWLQENLQAQGINCIVVHAADVPTKDKERKQKRDPLDSQKIARSLKSGELEAIYIPSKDCQQDRSLLRARHQIVATKRDAETGSGITEFFWNQLPSAKSFNISVIKIKTCKPINDL